jgi:hypothetical protein
MNAGPGQQVDHINGNRLDNRRENLRLCNSNGNNQNARLASHNTSGYKGVSWCKKWKKFQVRIWLNNRQRYLGSFTSALEAAQAYDTAARSMYGTFARLNFPAEGEQGVAL